jgi:DNA mismatch repair protein MutL
MDEAPRIRRLSASVINKIAAGEVVERPASVVKELVENSLDAGASRIEVLLEAGGLELIRIVDDGGGIAPDDLPLAVASHATSKLREADDLFRVRTLGFRGEALASISEVSRFLLRSRTANEASGYEIEVNGGTMGEVAPCACAVGTTIEVRDLFFNTPVRKKFLRTAQTEASHASETFLRLALASPNVRFTLRHGGRTLYDLPAESNWTERIAALAGREVVDCLIGVQSRDGDTGIAGYVADPRQSRSNNRMQYLFLNGRPIRDKALQHALTEAYRGLLMTGRHPIAFLRLSMPPESIDVNVHPTKMEVRFQESGKLYSQLLGTLRQKFLTTDLTVAVRDRRESGAFDPFSDRPEALQDPGTVERRQQELVDWARGQFPGIESVSAPREGVGRELPLDFPRVPSHDCPVAYQPGDRSPSASEAPAEEEGYASGGGLRMHAFNRESVFDAWNQGDAGAADKATAGEAPHERTRRDDAHGPPKSSRHSAPRAMQVHNRYLVAEDEGGMVIIDQHALHERIIYEQLRVRIAGGSLEIQRLLVPEAVELTGDEAAAVGAAQDLFRQVGFLVEPFGGNAVLLSGYPALLARIHPIEALREAADHLVRSGKAPDPRVTLEGLLSMMACKAAIKAGDPLTPEEMESLISQRHLCDDAHHCPHGRPTSLRFSRDELDRRFKRT